MITKEQWIAVKDRKVSLSKLTNKEIQKYLEEGNLITRREKGGTFSYWELGQNGELQKVNKPEK